MPEAQAVWTDPRTWRFRDKVTAAALNTDVRDNLLWLKQQTRRVADVAEHGAGDGDGSDDTQAFLEAQATGFDIYVPDGDFRLEPGNLKLDSGQSLLMAPGAVVTQHAAMGSGTHYLVDAEDVEDVEIIGGKLVGARASEAAGTTGGVRLAGANKALVDTEAHSFTRDGIYLAASTSGARPSRVTIGARTVCRSNMRNGLAVVACDRLFILAGEYSDTNGAAPECGIDIEPSADNLVNDVRIGPVLCFDNAGHGLQLFGKDENGRQLRGVTTAGAISRDNTGRGFRVARVSDASFAACDAFRNGAGGWRVDRGVDYPTRRNKFTGCGAQDNTGPGFETLDGSGAQLFSACFAEGNSTDGFLFVDSSDWTLDGCYSTGNGRHGLNVSNGDEWRAVGCQLRFNGQHGFRGRDVNNASLIANYSRANSQETAESYDAFHFTHTSTGSSNNNLLESNQTLSGGTQRHGVSLSSQSSNNWITGNDLSGAQQQGIADGGSGNVARHNKGHVTENHGEATIASGATSVTVSHGLDYTPAGSEIQISARGNATNDPGHMWVSAPGSSSFTINCRNDPGTSGLLVGWQVQRV